MTLEAGKAKDLELPVGTRIFRENATATQQPPSLVAEVSKELGGVTIALKLSSAPNHAHARSGLSGCPCGEGSRFSWFNGGACRLAILAGWV
jgi:hypothetical protein